jgi:autotransporter-associated beta strand protein
MKKTLVFWAAAALLCMATFSTNAAVSIWGGATSANWNVAANWTNGIPNPGDDITIADTTGSGNAMTLNDASHTNGLLTFGTTGTRNTQFTINGNTSASTSFILTLTNGISLSNYGTGVSGGNLVTKCPIVVANDQTWLATGTIPAENADYGIVCTLGAAGTPRPLTLNGTITKTGNGELDFIGMNVGGSGNIIVNGGWLKINAGSSSLVTLGGTGNVTVNNGGTLMIAKNSGTLSITRPIILNNGSTLRLFGNSSTLQVVSSPFTFNGNVPWICDFATLNIDFPGVWSGSITSTITTASGGGGTINLYGDHSGLSGVINNSGVFKIRFGGTAAASPAVAYGLNNASAFYEILGQTSISLGSLSGVNGTVRNSNTNSQPATATIGALNTSTTFGGFIADNTSTLALNKVGSGTLTLTTNSTFSGGTVIAGGGIKLLGASAALGSGPVTVQSGTLLSGSGTASGAITLLAGGSAEADGGPGAPPLNVGSLICGTNSTDLTTNNINVYLGGKIVNAGALVINGTNVINIVGAAPAVAVYDIITYTGGSIGGAGFSGIQLGALPFGVVANLQDSGTAVQLNVTAVTIEPGMWNGNVLSQWNLAGGLEWKGATSGNPQPYHDLDVVNFNDAAASFAVNVTANVTPTSVLITNVAQTYTFSGTGGIIGGSAVYKDWAGTVIFANSNNYSGGTYITNGTIQVGNGGTNGSIIGGVLNNGSLVFNRSDTNSLAGVISGSGAVTQTGTGTMILSGANTYTGITIVKSGILRAGNGAAFGDIAGSTVVSNGASLDENAQSLGDEPIEAIGAGVGGNGAIINTGPDQTVGVRFVTLDGDTTFGGTGRWDIRNPNFTGDPNGGTLSFLHGNNYNLTKVGSNVVAFINVGDTGLKDIFVQGGYLTFSRSSMMGDSSRTIFVWPGATFRIHRTPEFSNNNLNKVVSMTNAFLEVESNGLTNTFLGPITMTGTNTINLPAATGLIVQNSIGGNSALNITASGSFLALQGPTAAPLGTTFAGGVLEMDGALTTPTFSITAACTIMGNGSISAPVTIPGGSTLSPGDSVGNLTINNTLTLSPGSTSVFEINKDQATNDVVSGLTSVSYDGTLVLKNVGTTTYAPGDSFKLFNASSYSGKFATLVPAIPTNGLVWVTNALTTSGTISVAVLANPVPLVALSASSLVSTNINVLFSTIVDPGTAQDPSNYIFTNGANVIAATLLPSATNVLLTLDAPITNATYTLRVKTVQDNAYIPNVVATTNVPGVCLNFLEAIPIGFITNGSAYAWSTQGVIRVYSDGADIFGTVDHGEYIWTYITNDFDLAVRLESLLISDPAAKAGLMARDVPDPVNVLTDDRFFMSAAFTADPSRNNNFVEYREASSATAIAPGAPRPAATYPTNWLRLKRTGSFMQGFSGPNGLDWSPMTAVDSSTNAPGAYPDTIRVGLAATAHNAAATTEAIFSKYGKAHERGVLTGVQVGSDMVLSWQAAALGASLQTSPSLSPPVWTDVPGSTLTTTVTSHIGPTNLFFRLSQQLP